MLELTQFKAEFFKALAHPLRIKVLDAFVTDNLGSTNSAPAWERSRAIYPSNWGCSGVGIS